MAAQGSFHQAPSSQGGDMELSVTEPFYPGHLYNAEPWEANFQ